ncbi:MAG: hypothetical protein GX221_09030 [Candidatus Riflebacteria bacterium]|nr:hypothetical protein [Candidatus Riflebacteria bacterium]
MRPANNSYLFSAVCLILIFSISTAYTKPLLPVKLFSGDFLELRDETLIATVASTGKDQKALFEAYDKILQLFNKKYSSGEALTPDERHDYASVLTVSAIMSLDSAYPEDLEEMFLKAADMVPYDYRAFMLKGDFYVYRKKNEEALQAYEIAARLEPEYEMAQVKVGMTAFNTGRFDVAAEYFAYPHQNNTDDFLLAYLLAYACYKNHDFENARDVLENTLDLIEYATKKPEQKFIDNMKELLRTVKRYIASDEGSTQFEDQKFIISYAGSSEEDIGDMTLDALDEIYYEVTSFLDFDPHTQVRVTFLTGDDYAASGAMKWSAASAVGAHIIVPLKSGYKTPDYVKGVLAHEFTHAIIHMKTKGNIPTWLNEGIAQYQEFNTQYGSLETIRPDHEGIMKNMIESESAPDLMRADRMFRSPNANEARKGYVAAYLAVRYIVDTYGERTVSDICDALGKGMNISDALDDTIGSDLETFNDDYKRWAHNL